MAAEHAALVGSRVKAAREEKGLSQRELADRIPGKADGNQVSKWERGQHRVSDDTLKHIAKVLDHDLAWFHAQEADKTETPDLFSVPDRSGPPLAQIEQRLAAIEATQRALLSAIQELGSKLQAPSAGSRRKAG